MKDCNDVRKSITQRDPYGCGIACLAYALDKSYSEIYTLIPGARMKAKTSGFVLKELITVLCINTGKSYVSHYIKPHLKRKIYEPNTIVFIKRSQKYPMGHYLIRTEHRAWMDPWYNFPSNLKQAKSGFRRRLPGTPIYMIRVESR